MSFVFRQKVLDGIIFLGQKEGFQLLSKMYYFKVKLAQIDLQQSNAEGYVIITARIRPNA